MKGKSLAQLKRDCNAGILKMEMIERFGDVGDDIPERLRGVRDVLGANTVAIIFRNADGKESQLRYLSAKLVEYTDDELIVYSPGLREPTEEEKSVLDGINSIYQKYADTYNGGYWQGKDYGMKSSCPWTLGYDVIRGKRYERNNGKVRDYAVRGDSFIKYKVIRSE